MSNINNINNNFIIPQVEISKTEDEEDEKNISKRLSISSTESYKKLKLPREKEAILKKINNKNEKNENYENRIIELRAQISYLNSQLKLVKDENKSLKDEFDLVNYEKINLEKLREKDKIMYEEKYNDLKERYNIENEKYEDMSKKMREHTNKVNKYNIINNEFNDLKEENKYLSESNIELNNTINLLQKENILINQKKRRNSGRYK